MSKWTRREFARATLIGTAALAASPGRAEGPAAPPFPGSATPPTFLQPGARIVWFGGSASIAGVSQQIEPDENGNWVNKATGQRFSQFDTPSPAGAGFEVVDVLSADASGALVGDTQLLLDANAGNATWLLGVNGIAASFQNPAYWMSPSFLATLSDSRVGATRVMRMPYALSGRTYRAVRIQTGSENGWSQTTYDLDSGVALFSSSTAQGGPVSIIDPNNRIATGAGSTILAFNQFLGVRQTSLPGPGAVYPDAIRRLRSIRYSGMQGVLMTGVDMQVPPTPIAIQFDIAANTGAAMSVRMSVTGGLGGPTSADRLITAGTVGSLWMDPAVLGRLAAGGMLDQDAAVGLQVVGPVRRDNLLVVGLRTGLSDWMFGYDMTTGLLTRSDLRKQLSPATEFITAQLLGAD